MDLYYTPVAPRFNAGMPKPLVFWDGIKFWYYTGSKKYATFNKRTIQQFIKSDCGVKDTRPIIQQIMLRNRVLTGVFIPDHDAGELLELGGQRILCTHDRRMAPSIPGPFPVTTELCLRSLPILQHRSLYIHWLAEAMFREQTQVPVITGACHAGKGLLIKLAAMVIQDTGRFINHTPPATNITDVLSALGGSSKFKVDHKPLLPDLQSILHVVNLSHADLSDKTLTKLLKPGERIINWKNTSIKFTPSYIFILRCHKDIWKRQKKQTLLQSPYPILEVETADKPVDLLNSNGTFNYTLNETLQREMVHFRHYLASVKNHKQLQAPLA